MSRAYQIRVSETLTHHVHVEDGIQTRLELIGILSPDRTSGLLADELTSRGFTVEDGVARREVEPGIVLQVDTRDGTVSVLARAEDEVELSAEQSTRSYQPEGGAVEADLRQRVRSELQREARARDEEARKALSDRLDRVLAGVKPELDAVADAVTRSALKERAGQLGEVLEVSENAAGEMTIRVRV
jgi:hypothetical protein